MMDLAEVLEALGEAGALEAFLPHWQESEASFPEGGPPFLDPREITAHRQYSDLPRDLDPDLHRTARAVMGSEPLLRLAWHGYRLAFHHTEYSGFVLWPKLSESLGEELCGLFYLLIALTCVPRAARFHEAHRIPGDVSRDTCSEIGRFAEFYKAKHGGRWGYPPNHLPWLRNIARGDLYMLGRFNYKTGPFRGPVCVYRNTETGEALALAADGICFDGEGYCRRGQEISGPEDGWTSVLVVDENSVTGNPISPLGMAVNERVTLRGGAWKRVLAPGDPVLEVHIPLGGPMPVEGCAASVARAVDFFPRYFPDRPFAALAIHSWLFNTQIEGMLGPASNLARLQREVYLYPVPSTGKDGLYWIFGEHDVDPDTAPRDTRLRRAILDHLAAGKRLRNGGMFLLKEDVRHFGSQYYRSHGSPTGVPITIRSIR